MPIKQINPQEAHRLMQSGRRYVDVRTEGEFAAGHPEGAVNIPVVYPDPRAGGMRVNDEFVAVVTAHFTKDQPLILGCQAGGRSQRGAEMLAQAGFADVSNMQGGFGGTPDVVGWATAGLPVSKQCDDTNSYAGMKAGTKPR